MKHSIKMIFMRVFAFMFALMLLPMTAFASESKKTETPVGENTAWIRAKLTYQYDDGITGLNDSIIDFEEDWTKNSGWYYYAKPVNPGDRIRFITGVKIPPEWGNDVSDKKFRIVVTVEAAEVAPGDTGWNKNSAVIYSHDFDFWNKGYEHGEDVWVEEGKLSVSVNEYQIGKNGDEEAYINDKIITPGQHISKIVEFEIGGRKGANIKLKPEKPIKHVYVAGVDVDGKNVNAGTNLTYTITVKNPAPDERTITITDEVDERLVVVDTCGGTMIEKPKGEGDGGGTLEWKVDVPGFEEATVQFIARAPEGVTEKDAMVIPNTAEAEIVGKKLKSNTVIVGLGNPSALQKIIARATGDPSMLIIAASIAAAAILVVITIIVIMRKKNGKEEE